MLELREDPDYNEVLFTAADLCDFVIGKYNIKSYDEFQCPFFKALVEELYREVSNADG